MSKIETRMEAALKEIKDNLAALNTKFHNIELKINGQEQKTSEIQKGLAEILELKQVVNKISADNDFQKKKIKQLEIQLDNLQAGKLRKKIELFGLPKKVAEEPVKLLIQLAAKAKIPLQENELKSCYRNKDKQGREGSILATFKNVVTRDKVLKELRVLKPTLKDIGFTPEAKKIFCNEALTGKKKYLLYKAKEIAKIKGWPAVWTYSGDIFVKLETQGRQIKLQDIEDLELLIN